MIITLTGFMGVGKSSIAARLSKLLFCKHIDLDTYIETAYRSNVKDLFEKYGEICFRKLEEESLKKIVTNNREKIVVLSLGGGALLSKKNVEIIRDKTFCIYLKAHISTLEKRLINSRRERPLVNKESDSKLRERIELLFHSRRAGYEESSSLTIEVDNLSMNEILTKIMESI